MLYGLFDGRDSDRRFDGTFNLFKRCVVSQLSNFFVVKKEKTGNAKWEDFFNVVAPIIAKIFVNNTIFFNNDLLIDPLAFRGPSPFDAETGSIVKAK